MPLTDQQTAFVKKYVGAASASESEAPPSAKLLPIWRDAKEQTDTGVSDLQSALRRFNAPELDRIADAGLNGITEGNSVAILTALMEYDAADAAGKEATGGRLLKQVEAYRSFLDGSAIISLAENNPFGVSVAIKAPLHSALDSIAAAIGP